jgi:hypothetical protein
LPPSNEDWKQGYAKGKAFHRCVIKLEQHRIHCIISGSVERWSLLDGYKQMWQQFSSTNMVM